jgi:hypothetical protein
MTESRPLGSSVPYWFTGFRIVVSASIVAAAVIVVSRTALLAGEVPSKQPKAPAQALWIASAPYFSVLQGGELTRSGVAHPKLVFGNPAGGAGGLTFDGDNDLWGAIIGATTGIIFEFTPAQLRRLANHEKVQPAIEMDNAGGAPLHFDSAGNLWVAAPPSYQSYLVMYGADQLVSGPAPTPARTFTFIESIGNITDFAFDRTGNLWLDSDYTRNGEEQPALSELTPDQFAASASSVTPHLQLLGAAGKSLASDSSGDLWAVTLGGLYMFPPSELTGAGLQSVTPAITISSITDPDGIAFDAQGNLWAVNSVGGIHALGSIAEYAAGDITSSGGPQPNVLLWANRHRTNLDSPSRITIGPQLK